MLSFYSMKVLLIQPPIEDYYTTSIRNYPLGLLFVASKLVDICDVEIVDLRQGYKKSIKSPFLHLDVIYNGRVSPFSLFARYYRFGLTEKEIKIAIENKKPDLIGISSLFSTYSEEALQVAKIAKEIDHNIITVLGGNHPTLFPEDVLSQTFVDYVIRGEGEIPFKMLVERLKNRKKIDEIPGLCYKENDRIVINDIFLNKEINFNLKRELVSRENYKYGKGYVAPVLTSRGCPHNCYFCGKPIVSFRFYEEKDIKADIEKLIKLGFDTIDFEDDYFDITQAPIKNILNWLIGKNLRLTAMNGMVPKIDLESKMLLKKSGFQRINLSIVDVNKELQEGINRGQFKDFEKILNEFIETGIPIEVHFIIGLPEQREENLVETIIYLAEKKVLLGPSVYYMSPGSHAFIDHKKNGSNINLKYARSSALYPLNKDFTSVKLSTFLKLTRFINYIKSVIDNSGKNINIKELIEKQKRENGLEGIILETLIKDKKFISYDNRQKIFLNDVFDRDAVYNLFNKLRFVRGYKTGNICYINE